MTWSNLSFVYIYTCNAATAQHWHVLLHSEVQTNCILPNSLETPSFLPLDSHCPHPLSLIFSQAGNMMFYFGGQKNVGVFRRKLFADLTTTKNILPPLLLIIFKPFPLTFFTYQTAESISIWIPLYESCCKLLLLLIWKTLCNSFLSLPAQPTSSFPGNHSR